MVTRRDLNLHRKLLFGDRLRDVAYLCECGDPTCFATVRLSPDEYARLRPGIILAPGHDPVPGHSEAPGEEPDAA